MDTRHAETNTTQIASLHVLIAILMYTVKVVNNSEFTV